MSPSKRIVFLDYLRIFAFISVLVGHKFFWFFDAISKDPNAHASLRLLTQILHPLYFAGGAGVVVFFLVSGYIIPLTLSSETSGRFIIKRIFRIYPLYIFAVLAENLFLIAGGQGKDWTTVLAQMTLLGDFFNVPYALGQVEWTLRIEIIFYAYMALLKACGFMDKFSRILPYLLLVTVYALFSAPPFPYSSGPQLATGYFTAYAPLLLLGTFIWAWEYKIVSLNLLVVSSFFIFILFCLTVRAYMPQYAEVHYAAAGILVFIVSYIFRDSFADTPYIRLFSEITYGVYLFHNWLMKEVYLWIFSWTKMSDQYLRLWGLVVLFLVCLICNKTIERWGIKFGKKLADKLMPRKLISQS